MRIIYFFSLLLLLNACGGKVKQFQNIDNLPMIFPDYVNVTIPNNIAPLNFKVTFPVDKVQVVIKADGDEIICNGQYKINIPESKWKSLLERNKGKQLSVTVYASSDGTWKCYKTFFWNITEEPVDSHLVYRLIEPGYEAWNKMGIYQRNLESFEEKPIYENTMNEYSCVNCHTFCNQDPKTYAFHMRAFNTGTYLTRNGKTERLNMKNSRVFSASRYPIWHPSGRFMAFSINETRQFFHSKDKNRVEVYDKESDVVIYDVDKHEYVLAPELMRKDAFETFPAFSADGKTLYFCSADSVSMPRDYLSAKYSLCKVGFNPETGKIVGEIDTLFSARQTGKSVTVPRISPDGRFLMVSLSSYGQFHVWHKEANLMLLDLQTNRLFEPEAVNSDESESYHSWSNNSRWFVFSSRRVNGLYTMPFFSYIDKNGTTHKPFLLPQKDADFYDGFLYSYNIPELVTGEVDMNPLEMDYIVKTYPEIQVK